MPPKKSIVIDRQNGQKISQSNTNDSSTHNVLRPTAVNRFHPPIVPLKVNKAELILEQMNNKNTPKFNIVTTRKNIKPTTPVDPNYALLVELDRLATSSVPKQAIQPLKSRSPFTEAMIEKYKLDEERNIREAKKSGNYIQFINPPESMKPEIEEYDEDIYINEEDIEKLAEKASNEKKVLVERYKELQRYIKLFNQDLSENPSLRTNQRVMNTYRLRSLEMKGIENKIQSIDTEFQRDFQDYKDVLAEKEQIKKRNAIAIKNYEDMYRLLNKTLPIQQMAGESDMDYRDRLINFKNETNDIADEAEARTFEHKVFQRNLKKIISLPLHEVETLIKRLDGYMTTEKGEESAERVFQLNEIFPKVESEFIKRYGKDPLFRRPIDTLYDFFIAILSSPLEIMNEPVEAFATFAENIAETKGLESGKIDPSLEGLTKIEVMKLVKDAGLAKGKSAEIQKMKVNDLKILYTKYLRESSGGLSAAEPNF